MTQRRAKVCSRVSVGAAIGQQERTPSTPPPPHGSHATRSQRPWSVTGGPSETVSGSRMACVNATATPKSLTQVTASALRLSASTACRSAPRTPRGAAPRELLKTSQGPLRGPPLERPQRSKRPGGWCSVVLGGCVGALASLNGALATAPEWLVACSPAKAAALPTPYLNLARSALEPVSTVVTVPREPCRGTWPAI